MGRKSRFPLLGALCLAAGTVAVIACSSSARAEIFFNSRNHPALWKIETEDSVVHIFGSYHVLKKRTKWTTDRLLDIMEESETFVFEVDPTDASMPEAQAYIDSSGYLPDGQNLKDIVPAETHTSLQRLLRGLPLDEEELERQRPWLAQLTLATAFYGKRQYSVVFGADVQILHYALIEEREVDYLETPRQQLTYFAEAMETAPMESFEQVVDGLQNDPDMIVQDIRDWREGNVETIATRLDGLLAFNPDAGTILLKRRNEVWADKIETMLRNGGYYFITVGVGHLGGPGSVIDILCNTGWAVERVPTKDEEVPDACAAPSSQSS